MHIRDLAATTGTSERQVRYLIAEGFIPAPSGGRTNASYDDAHVTAIARYQKLRALGFPPAAIRLLIEARAGAPFPVVPGVTLVVDIERLGSGDPVEPLVDRLRSLLTDILRESSDADATRSRTD